MKSGPYTRALYNPNTVYAPENYLHWGNSNLGQLPYIILVAVLLANDRVGLKPLGLGDVLTEAETDMIVAWSLP